MHNGAMSSIVCVRHAMWVQGSLLDNQELLESLNQAKAKAATITASLQESQNVQVSPKTCIYSISAFCICPLHSCMRLLLL